jgi:hypothetical protein
MKETLTSLPLKEVSSQIKEIRYGNAVILLCMIPATSWWSDRTPQPDVLAEKTKQLEERFKESHTSILGTALLANLQTHDVMSGDSALVFIGLSPDAAPRPPLDSHALDVLKNVKQDGNIVTSHFSQPEKIHSVLSGNGAPSALTPIAIFADTALHLLGPDISVSAHRQPVTLGSTNLIAARR